MKLGTLILVGAAALALAGCKGSHNSSTAASDAGANVIATAASNVVAAVVSAGPGTTAAINTLYVSVKVCAPGSTTNCQTIDNVAVDTGASGLRILASVLTPTLAAALPVQVDANSNAIFECAEYADGYAWGPTAVADMTISAETAASLPIQVIGSTQIPAPPAAAPCLGAGPSLDTVNAFGANGTLGISVFAQDCGSDCALSLSLNSQFYYACSTALPASCSATTVPLTSLSGPQQIQNPVTYFPVDNAGVIVELPTFGASGAGATTGALVFGIDSQTNNASNTLSTVLTVDPVQGFVSTTLNNTAYPNSFFDTGSNGIYFDATTSVPAMTLCTDAGRTNLYCPAGTQNLNGIVVSSSNVLINIPFAVENADTLLGSAGQFAFNDLAGTTALPGVFDWGLPFFYGRNIYIAFQGKATALADGPYLAF